MQLSFIVAALVGWFLLKSIIGLVSTLLFWFGVLSFIVLIRRRRVEKLLDATGVGKVDFMNQKQFEKYLMDFFKNEGYTVKHTPSTHTKGATFTMTKNNETVAVFVHASEQAVTAQVIRQIVHALPKYNGQQVWVITNSQYNAEAIGLALQNSITPLDREDLLERAVLYTNV